MDLYFRISYFFLPWSFQQFEYDYTHRDIAPSLLTEIGKIEYWNIIFFLVNFKTSKFPTVEAEREKLKLLFRGMLWDSGYAFHFGIFRHKKILDVGAVVLRRRSFLQKS